MLEQAPRNITLGFAVCPVIHEYCAYRIKVSCGQSTTDRVCVFGCREHCRRTAAGSSPATTLQMAIWRLQAVKYLLNLLTGLIRWITCVCRNGGPVREVWCSIGHKPSCRQGIWARAKAGQQSTLIHPWSKLLTPLITQMRRPAYRLAMSAPARAPSPHSPSSSNRTPSMRRQSWQQAPTRPSRWNTLL